MVGVGRVIQVEKYLIKRTRRKEIISLLAAHQVVNCGPRRAPGENCFYFPFFKNNSQIEARGSNNFFPLPLSHANPRLLFIGEWLPHLLIKLLATLSKRKSNLFDRQSEARRDVIVQFWKSAAGIECAEWKTNQLVISTRPLAECYKMREGKTSACNETADATRSRCVIFEENKKQKGKTHTTRPKKLFGKSYKNLWSLISFFFFRTQLLSQYRSCCFVSSENERQIPVVLRQRRVKCFCRRGKETEWEQAIVLTYM